MRNRRRKRKIETKISNKEKKTLKPKRKTMTKT